MAVDQRGLHVWNVKQRVPVGRVFSKPNVGRKDHIRLVQRFQHRRRFPQPRIADVTWRVVIQNILKPERRCHR